MSAAGSGEEANRGAPVKQRDDAVTCRGCRRPTWSADGLCHRCRTGPPPPTEPAPLPLPPAAIASAAPAPAAETRTEVRIDDTGRIDGDVHCRACGYNLRGLETSRACPECAMPVMRSIRGDLLRFSAPGWVSRLSIGLRLIVGSAIAAPVFDIVGVVAVAVATGRAAAAGGGAGAGPAAIAVVATIEGFLSLVLAAGVWMLTAPDPGSAEREGRITARRVARWCAIARIAAAPLQTIGAPAGAIANPAVAPTLTGAVALTASMALTIVAIVGYFAAFVLLRRLALRIPDESIARQVRLVMWGLCIAQILTVIGRAIGAAALPSLAAARSGGPLDPALVMAVIAISTVACGSSVGNLVFGIWALVLLFILERAFARAADEARRTWHREGEVQPT